MASDCNCPLNVPVSSGCVRLRRPRRSTRPCSFLFYCLGHRAFAAGALSALLAILGSISSHSAEADETTATAQTSGDDSKNAAAELLPPIRVTHSGAAGDGGTVALELVGSNGKRLTLSISRKFFTPSLIPHDTLFLDVPTPSPDPNDRLADEGKVARLPYNQAEVDSVLRLLRLAIEDEAPARFSSAKNALDRLSAKQQIDVWDGLSDEKPAWFAAYEEERRQDEQAAAEWDALEQRFLACFPQEIRPLLETSTGEPYSDDEISSRALQIRTHFGNDDEMIAAICRANGILNSDSWESVDERDEILGHAVRLVGDREVVDVVIEFAGRDDEAGRGARRIFFDSYLAYVHHLEESEWVSLVPLYTRLALESESTNHQTLVVETLSEHHGAAATRLLQRIASGEIGCDSEGTMPRKNKPSMREAAYLELALRNDQSIADSVRQRLKTRSRPVDRAALEVSLALLGDHALLNRRHFQLRSDSISFAALAAIKQYDGRHGMDILMSADALGRLSGVQEAAVALASKLTGQQWQPSDDAIRSGDYAEEAASWWKANREAFLERLSADSNVRDE